MEFCCDEFRKEIHEHQNPDGHFEQEYDGTWTILGPCEEYCLIPDMKFCPFCGNSLTE